MEINTSITNGTTYYQMTNRGTDYSLRQYKGKWELMSSRRNFAGMPGIRIFNTLQELECQIKAFRGISKVVH